MRGAKGAATTRHLSKRGYIVAGYVTAIDAIVCADVSARLGAGRMKASDVVDPAVGLELYVDVGSSVKKGPLSPRHQPTN